MTVAKGELTARYHVDMCGALLGRTIVTEADYDAAFKEAIAEGKAVQDSLRHVVRTNSEVRAPANVKVPRRDNPPLAFIDSIPPRSGYSLMHVPEVRRDSAVKFDGHFGVMLGNLEQKYYATSVHKPCGGLAMPEVQDMQRLINADHTFGPLVQLTALPGGTALNNVASFDTGYVLIAVANVTPDPASLSAWYPMTTGYSRLHLVRLANCIYLKHTPPAAKALHPINGIPLHAIATAAPGHWTAAVIPSVGTDCIASGAASAPQLDVVAFSDTPMDSIPPAARFIEGSDEMSFIGVKCANAYCVLGPNPQSTLQNPVHAGAYGEPGAPKMGRRTLNPLWFDEQHLAIDDPLKPNRLVPGFRASIIPDTGLQNPARNYKDKWYPMAHVYIPSEPPKHYHDGFGFRRGWNEVRFRQVNGIWFAMIVAPDNTAHVREITPMEHTFGEVPGTVRFDWVDTDDLVWVPCEDGCCLVQDGRDY